MVYNRSDWILMVFLQVLVNAAFTISIPNELPTKGQLYVFAIPQSPSSFYTNVYMSSDQPANVYIEAPYINYKRNYSINRNTAMANFSSSLSLSQSTVTHKSIYIQSDNIINVHVLLYSSSWSDGFTALPLDTSSTDYYVFTYNNSNNEFIIAVGFDQTNINILLRTPQDNVYIDGSTYRNGQIIRKTMNKLESLQVQHDYDLTGTHITSTKPITVISGSSKVDVYYGLDTAIDQIRQVSRWKLTHIVAHLASSGQSFVRIISATNGTKIKINDRIMTTLGTGEFYERLMSSGTVWCIEGDQPISVVQTLGIVGLQKGYPFMISVSPVDEYLTSYVFSVPSELRTSYVDIFIESDQVSGLRLDGKSVLLTLTRTVIVHSLGKTYSVGRFLISKGQHIITHQTPGVHFGAVLYGFDTLIAYGFTLGMSSGPICLPSCKNNGTCVAENTCHCQHGFHGAICELGTVLSDRLKPHFYPVIEGNDKDFMNSLSWYSQPSFSDGNKACFVKVLLRDSDQTTIVSATSRTTNGTIYGNFTTAPIDSTSGIYGQSRFACVEVRCPFVTINGTLEDTVVKVQLEGQNDTQCRVGNYNQHLTSLAIQHKSDGSDEVEFTLEVGKNYGPFYGVYMAIGTRDKARFLAEHKCNSGREYDYESYNPDIAVIAEYMC